MERYGMIIKVKPEKLEEYKRLHAAVWPEKLDLIRGCRIKNYSIFYQGGYVFSYYEYYGDDYQKDMAKFDAAPINRKWGALCRPCLEPVPERAEGERWVKMEEFFHLD